jgi:LysM repeat protein
MAAYFSNQPGEVDMKTVLVAFACITLLAACKKDEPVPVATEPVVVVPADTTPVTPATEAVPATTTATPTTPEPGSSGSSVAGAMEGSGNGMYVVERGDTLWGIAEKNTISHGDLAKWNNINDPRELQVGRQLRLTAP